MSQAVSGAGFEPRVVILYCQYAVAKDQDLVSAEKEASGFQVGFVMLPCSSKLEISHLFRILESGADRIEVIGCPEGLCRFLVGNLRTEKRIQRAKNLLDQIKMGAQRVNMSRAEGLDKFQLLQLAKEAAEQVKKLGPNPMKGEVSK